MAINNPTQLLNDFRSEIGMPNLGISHTKLTAGSSHQNRKPRNLTKGKIGVYVFSLSHSYGSACRAGSDRVLRVGKASGDGRLSQHYGLYKTATSLAHYLNSYTFLWSYLGISAIPTNSNWASWIESNTDRDQFELDPKDAQYLQLLEKYIRGITGPVFEG